MQNQFKVFLCLLVYVVGFGLFWHFVLFLLVFCSDFHFCESNFFEREGEREGGRKEGRERERQREENLKLSG